MKRELGAIPIIKELSPDKILESSERTYIIDSTTISLCFSKYRWAYFRSSKSGIKVHLRLNFHKGDVFPDKAEITPAKPNDKSQMDAMVVQEENALNVFDRTYVDYRKFDNYSDENARFVTRLKENAVTEVIEEIPAPPESPIKQEQVVRLGNSISYKTENHFRLIKSKDSNYQPFYVGILYTLLQKFYHPLVIYIVEESFNVSIYNIADFAFFYGVV